MLKLTEKHRQLFFFFWLTLPLLSVVVGMPFTLWSTISGIAWLGLTVLVATNVAILSIPWVFVKNRRIQRLVFLPLLAIALFTFGYMTHNGSSPSPAVFIAIFRTNSRELEEVLPDLVRTYAVSGGVFLGMVCWIWYLPAPLRPMSKVLRIGIINLAIWLINGFLVAWAFWPAGFARIIPSGAEYTVFPGSLLFTAYNAFSTDVNVSLSDEQIAFRFGATATDVTQPLRVVLVIGESSTATRWHLWGHDRPTNPMLTRLSDGQLIFFPDVLATATSTRPAVPILLTRATPVDLSPTKKERSIVSAFAESGYVTAWLSNQDRFPYSDEASNEVYVNPDWSSNTERYDETLLPFSIRQIENNRRLFMVIHTLGSHVTYRNRVPEQDRFFARGPSASRLDDYDDTIRYTDKFLASLINVLQRTDEVPSVLLYVSDHGQDVGRLIAGDVSQGLSVFQQSLVHVPLLVWMSPGYLNKWPTTQTILAQNRLCPHSQMEVFHTLIKLGHIKLPSSGPSLFDPDCHRLRPILVGAQAIEYR